MKLTNPTDDELNIAFAEKVAGMNPVNVEYHTAPWSEKPRFTQSADAVLPWLEKEILWDAQSCIAESQRAFRCWIRILTKAAGERSEYAEAREPTFPRAAVIALLRAHGVEIEFTAVESAAPART